MKVICVDPKTDSRWEALTRQFGASVFHSPQWMKVLAQTYGFEVGAYLALNNSDEVAGGVALCAIEDFLGERLVALPFSDHFDPLVNDRETWNALVHQIAAKNLPFSIRCLHNAIPLQDSRFVATKRAKWHGLKLAKDPQAIWDGFKDPLKRNIKKAAKAGVTVEISSDEAALKKFFQLHLRLRKNKYKLLAQPFKFFQNIWTLFLEAQKLFLFVARCQDEIVSCGFFLGWGSTFVYKFGASNPEFLNHRPNDLLFWEAIKFAVSQGYAELDFGLSDLDQEGLIRFKAGFGAQEKEIAHLTRTPAAMNNGHDLGARKSLLGNLTKLLTDSAVPDEITEKGGDLLYQYFT
jgi:CelD/BcsL family acetyltransferase involved in cellulose biosynthesis